MPAQPRARNAFLSALSDPELALIRSHLTPFDLPLGSALHRVGDEIERIIFPHSGLVAIILLSKEGGSVAITLVGRDGIAGGFGAAASTVALCEARVLIAGEASASIEPLVLCPRCKTSYLSASMAAGDLPEKFQAKYRIPPSQCPASR